MPLSNNMLKKIFLLLSIDFKVELGTLSMFVNNCHKLANYKMMYFHIKYYYTSSKKFVSVVFHTDSFRENSKWISDFVLASFWLVIFNIFLKLSRNDVNTALVFFQASALPILNGIDE